MLWAIVVVLIVLWLLGLVLRLGGAIIHLLLIIAIIALLIRVIKGRNPMTGA